MAQPLSDDDYPCFFRTGYSFEERTGNPDAFSCAIGRISIWFSALEDQLTTEIHKLLDGSTEAAAILTAEMSFKNKVHALASIVRHLSKYRRFNTGETPTDEALDMIVARCFQAEELRNQVLHSSWVGPFLRDGKAIRKKTTAKASRGLHVKNEEMDADYLLDIADFIAGLGSFIEEFFL